MVSISAIIGNTITPEPMFETISKNPTVVPLSRVMLNFGKSNSGKPDGILPATQNSFNDQLLRVPITHPLPVVVVRMVCSVHLYLPTTLNGIGGISLEVTSCPVEVMYK